VSLLYVYNRIKVYVYITIFTSFDKKQGAIYVTEKVEPNVLTFDLVLNDPTTSYWLKTSLKGALIRDPVDAANDAHILADLLNNRADGILQSDAMPKTL